MNDEWLKTFQDKIKSLVSHFSTCLVREYSNQQKMELIGAGTFVSIGDVFGIITAYHVVDKIQQGEYLGLVLMENEHHFSIPANYLRIIIIGRPTEYNEQPDLAFIIIPEVIRNRIQVYKSFFELGNKHILKEKLTHRNCIAFGTIGKRTKEETPGIAFSRVLNIRGFIGFSIIEDIVLNGEFDYITISVDYNSEREIPETFGGMSGGGVWVLKSKNYECEDICLSDLILCGVIYYQSERVEDKRNLIAHGAKSIYKNAVNRINKEIKI